MLTEFRVYASHHSDRTSPEFIGKTLDYGEALDWQDQAILDGYATAWMEEVPIDLPQDAGT